ncbi:MAG: hypothetical protein ACM3JI_00975 [Anaerolineae bacterium]
MSKKKKEHSSSNKNIHDKMTSKQKLEDLEHKINADLGDFLVLNEEGNQEQIDHARHKAKNDLLKFGPDMYKIASEMGGKYPNYVDEYLESIDSILHSPAGWIDNALITHCFKMMEKLDRELSKE